MARQSGRAIGRVDDRLEVAGALLLAEARAGEKIGGAADHRHQIVEIVGDSAGQLAQRLQLLGLEQGRPRFLQLLGGAAPLRDVAGDLGEAEQLAPFIVDGVEDDARPEARTVLADPPRLLLIFALRDGGGERPLRLAGGAVLVRIEAREMLADDLVGLVALDRLRPRIPVRDEAVRIDHVESVILDALDEGAEPPLAFEQRLLRLAFLRIVAGDLCEADQLALGAHDRVEDGVHPEAGAVLSNAPPLRLEPSFPRRRLERALGDARGAVLLGEEGREMAADNLLRLISLEPAGARIPGRDIAVGVEHVDGVIGDGVDEQLETLGRYMGIESGTVSHPATCGKGGQKQAEGAALRPSYRGRNHQRVIKQASAWASSPGRGAGPGQLRCRSARNALIRLAFMPTSLPPTRLIERMSTRLPPSGDGRTRTTTSSLKRKKVLVSVASTLSSSTRAVSQPRSRASAAARLTIWAGGVASRTVRMSP